MLLYTHAYTEKLGECTEMILRTRALENQMYVCGMWQARNEKLDHVCYGHSLVCDAFGRVIKRVGDREEILFHDFGRFNNIV